MIMPSHIVQREEHLTMDPYVQAKKAIYNEIVCLEQNDGGLNIRHVLEWSSSGK